MKLRLYLYSKSDYLSLIRAPWCQFSWKMAETQVWLRGCGRWERGYWTNSWYLRRNCNGESARDLRVLQQCCDACAAPCPILRAMSRQDLALIPRHSINLKSTPGSSLWYLNLSSCSFSPDLTRGLSYGSIVCCCCVQKLGMWGAEASRGWVGRGMVRCGLSSLLSLLPLGQRLGVTCYITHVRIRGSSLFPEVPAKLSYPNPGGCSGEVKKGIRTRASPSSCISFWLEQRLGSAKNP